MSLPRNCLGIGLLVVTTMVAAPAMAGPCTKQIASMQGKVDAAIEANAGSGRTGKETTFATRSNEPTPKTLAQADAQINKWTGGEKALAALAKARTADKCGQPQGVQKRAVRSEHRTQGPVIPSSACGNRDSAVARNPTLRTAIAQYPTRKTTIPRKSAQSKQSAGRTRMKTLRGTGDGRISPPASWHRYLHDKSGRRKCTPS